MGGWRLKVGVVGCVVGLAWSIWAAKATRAVRKEVIAVVEKKIVPSKEVTEVVGSVRDVRIISERGQIADHWETWSIVAEINASKGKFIASIVLERDGAGWRTYALALRDDRGGEYSLFKATSAPSTSPP